MLRTPQGALRWAVLFGVVGAGIGAILLTTAIGRSSSSTAAFGFIELPAVTLAWALPSAAMGFCLAYLIEARKLRASVASFRVILPAVVLLAIAGTSATYIFSKLLTGWEVGRIATMNEQELGRVLTSKYFGENPFVLAEIAQSRQASSAILRQIAIRPAPELHRKLWSIFDTMGSNKHGLAVMRLVARNPNVDSGTLDILAESADGYVLSDVAMNPKVSEQTLARLEAQSDPILEWSLARNPRASSSLLARLSRSSSESVRSQVAANPSTPPEDLIRLGQDPQATVRSGVASNPRAPESILEVLRHDPDDRVRAALRTR